jgi:hypothetical protein
MKSSLKHSMAATGISRVSEGEKMSALRVVITGVGKVINGAGNVDRAWEKTIKKRLNFSYKCFNPESSVRS